MDRFPDHDPDHDHDPGAAPAQVPIAFHADVPDHVLARISGVPTYTPENAPVFGLDEKVTRTPALKLRASRVEGGEATWTVVDSLSKEHRVALGERKARVRLSTGLPESDRAAALDMLVAYTKDKRSRVMAHLRPADIPLGAILLCYQDHLDFGAHRLRPGTVNTYSKKLAPLGEFFGMTPLGALTPKMEKDFEAWRAAQSVRGLGAKAITQSEVAAEIAALRQAINHLRKGTQINLNIVHYMPRRDTPPVVWWKRSEVARYLWACRGRVSTPVLDGDGAEAGQRWMVWRDVDPTLTGPEGDRRVLRPPEEVERRRAEARRVRLGIYAPSRAKVLIDTVYADENGRAYVSLIEGAVRRMPIGPDDSTKRRPPAPLGPKLRLLVAAWARLDAAPNGFRANRSQHLVHQPDGSPCSTSLMAVIRNEVLADCGVRKRAGANVLRHTAAMWMKIEGVSAWIAADFLGCSTEVLVERYGTWDNLGLYEAAQALCRGAKQKAAMARAEADGVLHLM